MSEHGSKRFQPLSLRIWHWSNALIISGLLATVLLRKTFLSWRINAALIEEKVNASGVVITSDLAKEIAVAMRDKLWQWHIYLGFALAALLAYRVGIAIMVEKRWSFLDAIRDLTKIKQFPKAQQKSAVHHALVRSLYTLFYLATAIMVISGLLMVFSTELGIAKETLGSIKETHEFMMWFFVIFVAVHVVGVVVAENSDEPGLISDMVNGGKSRD